MYPHDFDDLLVRNRREFDALESKVQVAYCLHRLEAEVNNGGYHQFFTNATGAYAVETLAALGAIGANRSRELLAQAVQLCFPNGYPEQADDYENYIIDFDEIEERVNALDREFYRYVEPLDELVNAYLTR